MFSSWWSGNSSAKAEASDVTTNPLTRVTNRMRSREDYLEKLTTRLNDVIDKAKSNDPISPTAASKQKAELKAQLEKTITQDEKAKTSPSVPATTKELKEDKKPHVDISKKSEWHLSLAATLQTVASRAGANINDMHEKMRSFDLSGDVEQKDVLDYCEAAKNLVTEIESQISAVLQFSLICRRFEDGLEPRFLKSLGVSGLGELLDREIFRETKTAWLKIEADLDKLFRDLNKAEVSILAGLKELQKRLVGDSSETADHKDESRPLKLELPQTVSKSGASNRYSPGHRGSLMGDKTPSSAEGDKEQRQLEAGTRMQAVL
jgi:hypothetical protein